MNSSFIKIFLFLVLPVSTNCFCQSQESADITDVTKATFFNPGFSYEKRMGKLQSLYAQVFMNTSIALGFSEALGNTSSIYFDPAVSIQYRYYYNFKAREDKGKRTEMNSLNYIAGILETTFSKGSTSSSYLTEKDRRAINVFGIAWGFQRNYPKRFSLDINFGPGYLYTTVTTMNDTGQLITKNAGQFIPVGQINLGFWLNKRN